MGETLLTFRSYAGGRLVHAARVGPAPDRWPRDWKLCTPVCGRAMSGVRHPKYNGEATPANVTCGACRRIVAPHPHPGEGA